MPGQTSFRLPKEMLRELARRAKQRGVPKSQLVREALELYLGASESADAPVLTVRERSAPLIGSIDLSGRTDGDVIAVRIRRQNWRD